MRPLRRLLILMIVLLPWRGHAQPINIHIKLAWLDARNCPACTVAVLRSVADGGRVFGSSVMLQDYDQLANPRQRGIDISAPGPWKCVNHTQGPSAPDPRLRGVNFEVCLRLTARSGQRLTIGYIMHTRDPNGRDNLIVETMFAVDVIGPTSRLPSFSDGPEGIGEDRLVSEHRGEAFDEWDQLLFGHVRHQVVEHGALAEQRMGAALGGV
jgi:hypothetical protein